MDSSWYLEFSGVKFLVDPWLEGPEIDGFKWLNEQWHTTPSVSKELIPKYDVVLVSQSYEDHCHLETLKECADVPILATKKAYNKLLKHLPNRNIERISDKDDSMVFNGLRITAFRPKKIMDPIYYAVCMFNSESEGIFYAPHGFELSEEQKVRLDKINIKLLVTTFSRFQLPGILGGLVNPGLENVKKLISQLDPEVVINTHDEKKTMNGLVGRFAKVIYPDYGKLKMNSELRFHNIPDYNPVRF